MKLKYIWSVILGGGLLLSSCENEINENNGPTGGEENLIPIRLGINGLNKVHTYGVNYDQHNHSTDDVAGVGVENVINDIIVFIYDNTGAYEKTITGTMPLDTVMVKSGYKSFIAVVNSQGKVTFPPSPTFSQVCETVTSAMSSALPNSTTPVGFLMAGTKDTVLAVNYTHDNPHTVPIEVERASAKVTVNITKSGKAQFHNIKIRSITMYRGADRVAVLTTPNPNPAQSVITDGPKTSFSNGGVLQNSPTYINVLDTFYTYENLIGSDSAKAVFFRIEAEDNMPTNLKYFRFYLGETSNLPGDSLYNIKRNYWYNVNVSIVDTGSDSLKVEVKACPWNNIDTVIPVGGGFEVHAANPMKLVKTYTEAELSGNSGANGHFAAINKHSKGAAWIDLKVTEGTTWSLDFKPGYSENAGSKMAIDGDTTNWTSDWKNSLSGTGDGQMHRIYIYRPYKAGSESNLGPKLALTVGGTQVRDFVVQPRDTIPVPTNCFIMRPQLTASGTTGTVQPINETRAYIPLKGVYRHWEDELLVNGDSIPTGTCTAELLWQDRQGEVIKQSSLKIINANDRDNSYLYAEAGEVKGNAIVAFKVNGTIYWSFHLWVTEYDPYQEAGWRSIGPESASGNLDYADHIFMDRDLGAIWADDSRVTDTINRPYDIGKATTDLCGFFYQYGRKDPFPKAKDWNATNFSWSTNGSSQTSGSLTTSPFSQGSITASTTLRPKTAIINSFQSPMKFINNNAGWHGEERLFDTGKNIWLAKDGTKTAYDPCPEGWRIPIQKSTSTSPFGNLSNFTSPSGKYKYGIENKWLNYFALSGGYNTTLANVGTNLYLWTTYFSSSSQAYVLSLRKSGTIASSTPQSMISSASVRCCIDARYKGTRFTTDPIKYSGGHLE